MDCFECDNKGYLEDVLNTKDNVIETQRCDNCQVFETDEDAKKHQESEVVDGQFQKKTNRGRRNGYLSR